MGFAVWVSDPWRHELVDAVGPVLAWLIPIVLAYIPGLVLGFMIFTLLVNPYHELSLAPPRGGWPAVTVVVAGRNEEHAIGPTIQSLAALSYGGWLEVVLADNGSTDRTRHVAEETATRFGLQFRTVVEREPGKHHTLNAALATVRTPIVVTVDADTFLQREALTYLVTRLLSAPRSWRTGAFSAYWADDLRAVGGRPDAIGEDIVLTWALLGSRGITQYEPVALGLTVVPERLGRLLSQRSRWARECSRGYGRIRLRHSRACWPSSSRVLTTSCRSSTSG